MGDRGNVLMLDRQNGVEGRPGIFLYSHWRGSDLPGIVAAALDTPAARGRYTDLPYLTRIMADVLSAFNGGPGSETGMGISLGICDNEHPIIVVDVATQRVWFSRDDEALRMPPGTPDLMHPGDALTFAEFIAAHNDMPVG